MELVGLGGRLDAKRSDALFDTVFEYIEVIGGETHDGPVLLVRHDRINDHFVSAEADRWFLFLGLAGRAALHRIRLPGWILSNGYRCQGQREYKGD